MLTHFDDLRLVAQSYPRPVRDGYGLFLRQTNPAGGVFNFGPVAELPPPTPAQ